MIAQFERMFFVFYDHFLELCNKKGVTPSKAALLNGISKTSVTRWKNGATPNGEILKKLSDYFGVTTDYLLTGKKQENIRVYDEDDNVVVLDDETLEIIDSLRKRPDMKILFSVSKKAKPEDIIKAVKIIEALRDTKEGD